jgi:hypothetical protein
MHIMASELILTAYFINLSDQFVWSVCLYVYPIVVARQRLGENTTAQMTTHVTIEVWLDA